eukprot:m.126718 g.126718  ORF g.126718 m.126718 type:complete len:95 (-) comp23511_c0_seq3:81-365(-)
MLTFCFLFVLPFLFLLQLSGTLENMALASLDVPLTNDNHVPMPELTRNFLQPSNLTEEIPRSFLEPPTLKCQILLLLMDPNFAALVQKIEVLCQ